MKKTGTIFSIVLTLILVSHTGFSAGTKKRVAILDFKPINAKETYAKAVRNLFEVALYKKDAFDILERNQIDTIMREQGMQMTGCTETSCAIQIGKILSADIIVTGSLNLLGRYTIAVKFVDVSGANILLADSEAAVSEDDLNAAVNTLADRMSGKIDAGSDAVNSTRSPKPVVFHLSAGFAYLQPLGRFWSISDYGLGTTVGLDFEIRPAKHYCIGLEAGFWYLDGAKESVKESYMVPVLLATGYRFIFREHILLKPTVSGGLTVNSMTYDPDGSQTGGSYDYKTETEAEAMMKIGLWLGYMFDNPLSVQVGAEYAMLFENRLLHFMIFSAGLDFRF